MNITLNLPQSTALLIVFLFIGVLIQSKVSIFKKYYVPAPLIGGIILSVLINLFNIKTDFSLLPIFVAGFFASIGLRISKDLFKKGFMKQLLFLGITIFVAIFQNVFIIGIGKMFNLAKGDLILHSSLSLMGDSSLQAVATSLVPGENDIFLSQLSGISVLCIILGTLIGGIFFKIIESKNDFSTTLKPPAPSFSNKDLLKYAVLFSVSIGLAFVPDQLGYGKFINPAGGAFLAGLIIRFLCDQFEICEIQLPHVNLIGGFSLSMLLVTVFSSMSLIALKSLDLLNVVIILLQILWLMIFSYFIVYKMYGKSDLAAFVSSGLLGFSIGVPASTMAFLQYSFERKGAMPLVLLIVPTVGMWLITIFNPIVINLFF